MESMEASCSTEKDDNFFNAIEEFPFYDCLDCTFESEPESQSHPSPSHSFSSSSGSNLNDFSPNKDSSSGLRRRSFIKNRRREPRPNFSEDPSSGTSTAATGGGDGRMEKLNSFHSKKNHESVMLDSDDGTEPGLSEVVESVNKGKCVDFMITGFNDDGVGGSGGAESSTARGSDEDQSGFIVFLVELVIKAIGFQLSLVIGFITFPFWLMHASYMFLLNPFLTIRRVRHYLGGKIIRICNMLLEAVAPSMSEWFKENHSFVKVVVRCAWGLFWSAYLCLILVGLLVSAFVGSGLIMRCLVEEPFHQKQSLNFDFTENKPVAIVPITAAWSSWSTMDYGEQFPMETHGVERAISSNRKLQATISLTLPESDYNRKLGMFQVRIEFMCANGKILASLRQACMLHYRSEPIRLLQMFLKFVPLVAGYLSESQKLNLKFQGFTEGEVPSAYLKVRMEQRAEYRPAGGIPEVYDAGLVLESELPFLKSILWSWRKTLFVWMSMVLFLIELLFALICCRTVVMPRLRSHYNPTDAVITATQTEDEQYAR